MNNAMMQLVVFIAIGVAWRYFKPDGYSADAVQRAIISIIYWVLLPIFIFFAMAEIKFNAAIGKYVMYVTVATAVALAAGFFWFSKTKLQPKVQGALLLAACFGSVVFIGLPLTKIMVGSWTSRLAATHFMVANVLLLYTAGLFLARALGSPSKLKKPAGAVTDEAMTLAKDPLLIAAVLGVMVNVTGMKIPAWLNIDAMVTNALIPLLVLTLGLSLKWEQNWKDLVKDIAPVAVIKMVLIPVVLLLMVKLFGSPGAKTTKAMMINGVMPVSLLGLIICERFKFETRIYAAAFVMTTALAVVLVPVWMKLI
ncbi:MAG: AEC family transporter [Gammaproteobacteria bacterium]|nr:AEC family transporter [Gammaproteobacteria bacterium]MDH5800588.1 AEC family transporter [Gammaproteobacteria bacterium]